MSDWKNYDALPNKDYFVEDSSIYDKERDLYESLLSEAFNKNGTVLIYYTSTYSTSKEQIFGEDDDRFFGRKFEIMGYYDLPKEDQLWSKWGIEGLDNFKINVSKKHFTSASTSADAYSAYTPKVGDLIRAKYNNIFYEVIDVGEEEEMFLNRKHSWGFLVKPFVDSRVRLSADTSATMNILSAHTNQEEDLFNISDVIDTEKTDILYNQPDSEDDVNDIWSNW